MACETQQDKVQNLKAQLDDLRAQRAQRGDDTVAGDRRLGAMIHRVQLELAAAQSELDACMGKVTPVPPGPPAVIGNVLTPPYRAGRSAQADLFKNASGSAGWGADPVAGVAHALAGIDHSRNNVVHAAAIDLPVADRCIIRVELTITYDMFTWATHGKPPLIGWRVRLERGRADGPIQFDTAGLGPPPQGPIVTPVGTAGAPPVVWTGQHYLGQPDGSSVSETRTINQSVEIVVTDRIRLSAFAVAWGGADGVDVKHSGGGVRVIATIAKIQLLPPGAVIL